MHSDFNVAVAQMEGPGIETTDFIRPISKVFGHDTSYTRFRSAVSRNPRMYLVGMGDCPGEGRTNGDSRMLEEIKIKQNKSECILYFKNLVTKLVLLQLRNVRITFSSLYGNTLIPAASLRQQFFTYI